ncbi:MAG: gamma-glutamylcyclotransferase family protein [Synechococcaceae cyanobacterium]|nr:gamma-glutamylcyclotransferase family protein [Synechococcaceae cyanobacterium]
MTPIDPQETIPVFVYGTLRRGQANHHLLRGAHWGGEQRLPGARLHDLGPFPMAIATPDTAADAVQGELWWVDAATLARLDHLEGHPRLYERRRLALASGQRAWVYLGRPKQVRHSPVLAEGCWPRTLAGAVAAPTGCRAWQASRGEEPIRLGNSLGAAHYLTKNHRLQISPAEAPLNLYRDSDLRRLCDGRR